MKSFVALAFAGVAAATQREFEFMQYVAEYAKQYNTVEEFAARFANWTETHKFILHFNNSD